ncbi:nucleophile aminohydrolase [Glomus cerebriforme]|uniref:beta-aspartyl-peptidase n=1 Tax=Glomus cerebriforme TaxID=658196 RepID=A0A397SG89_9GLOM|nr:nucleophile aminohydrolase [Glomus cerebriforme]
MITWGENCSYKITSVCPYDIIKLFFFTKFLTMPKSIGCLSVLNDLYTSILGDKLYGKSRLKVEIDHGPTLVIHGGAGIITCKQFSLQNQEEYIDALKKSLMAGYKILLNGGNSIDVVEAAVRIMEDCPLFNAGKGSVFTISGKNELESSIMIGTSDHPAGASTLLHTVKNPITLAKTLLLDPENRHVFLGGVEAEEYAKKKGLGIVDPCYFWTKRRWKQHLEGLENGNKNLATDLNPYPKGTVGAVAVDKNGIIATATSTGGWNNKKDGRIGDTPLIACGTWADNETCGVSGTGDGEFFIRYGVAQDVSSRMRYLGESVNQAADGVVKNLGKVGGSGGVIALDKYGNVAMPFNTGGMYRGYIRVSDGIPYVYIF